MDESIWERQEPSLVFVSVWICQFLLGYIIGSTVDKCPYFSDLSLPLFRSYYLKKLRVPSGSLRFSFSSIPDLFSEQQPSLVFSLNFITDMVIFCMKGCSTLARDRFKSLEKRGLVVPSAKSGRFVEFSYIRKKLFGCLSII